MKKSAAAGTDPFLALLEWRNTPREGYKLSPAQILFGRRTRSKLPTADVLLSTATAQSAQRALSESKQKQAFYYNRGAKERPVLSPGQTVRVKFDDDWRKAEIERQLSNRSYNVKLEDGSTRRRTSRHVRFSSEPPIVFHNDDLDTAPTSDDATAPVPPPPPPPGETRPQSPSAPVQHESSESSLPSTDDQQQPPTQRVNQRQQRPAVIDNSSQKTTRSGRVVKIPARYKQ